LLLKNQFVVALLAAALLGLLAPRLNAAIETWQSATGGDWSNTGNWSNATVPGNTSTTNNADTAIFNSSPAIPSVGLAENYNLEFITFASTSAGSFTIGQTSGGGSLLLTSGGTIQIANSVTQQVTETIDAPIVLEGAYTFTDAGTGVGTSLAFAGGISGAFNLTLNGANNGSISGTITTGAGALIKSGIGTWALSGANTNTGSTTVTAGALQLNFNAAGAPASNILNNAGGALILGGGAGVAANYLGPDGGTLNVNGASSGATAQTIASLTLNGGLNTVSITNNGASTNTLTFTSATLTRNLNGAVDFISPANTEIALGATSVASLGTWAFYGSGAAENYAATVSGSVGAIAGQVSATGINNITAAATNYTYVSPGANDTSLTTGTATGNTAVFNNASAQTITLAANTGLSLNGFLNTNAPLTVAGAGNLVIGSNKEFVIGGAGNVTISTPIVNNSGGASGLTNASTGVVTLSGANTFSGTTNLDTGTLVITNPLALQNSNVAINTANGLGFATGVDTATVATLSGTYNETLVDAGNNPVTLTIGNNNTASTYNGTYSGPGGALVKVGTGTIIMDGLSTNFAGGTVVQAGYLDQATADTNNPLGSGPITLGFNGGTANAEISFIGTAGSGSIQSGLITISANDSGTMILAASGGNNQSYGGPVYLGSPVTFQAGGGNNTAMGGSITGTNNITVNETNNSAAIAMEFNQGGLNPDWSGNLIIQQGQVGIEGNGRNEFTANNTLTVMSSGTYNSNFFTPAGNTETIAGLTGAGTVVSTYHGVIQIAGTGTYAFSGTIGSNTIGSATNTSLTKIGSGTQILSGANIFTGATTVSGGILNYQNATAFGVNSAITVASGGTVQVQGSVVGSGSTLTIAGIGAASSTPGNAATGALESVSGANGYSGPIFLSAAATISVDAGTFALTGPTITGTATGPTLTLTGSGNGSISDVIATTTGGLTMNGVGTWTLSATNTYTGTTTVNAGTLGLNFATATAANLLPTTNALVLGGGAFNLSSATTGSNAQTLASLALNSGASTVSITPNGSGAASLAITNALTRSTGGTVDFVSPAGTMITLAGNPNAAFLGTYAFFGTGAAETYAATVGGSVGATTSQTAASSVNNFTSSTTDYTYTSPGATDTLTAPGSADTAVFATASAQVVELNGNSLTLNGFLNAGAPLTIQDSTNTTQLVIGGGNELVIGGTGNVTISAPVVNTSGSTGALTYAGTGALNLSGVDTYTGASNFDSGTVNLTGSLTGGTAITVNPNATLTQAAGSVISGAASLATSGAVTLGGTNTYTGATAVNGGTLALTGSLGASPVTVNAGAVQLNNTGALSLSKLTVSNALSIVTENSVNALSGTAALTQSAGLVVLSQSNNYTGATSFTGGVLQLQNAGSIASSALTINTGILQLRNNSNTTFQDASTTQSASASINVDHTSSGTGNTLSLGNIAMGGGYTITVTNGDQYNLTLGMVSTSFGPTFTNNMVYGTLTVGGVTENSASAQTAVFNAAGAQAVTSVGSITQPGGGALAVTQASGLLIFTGANSYTGATSVNGNILLVENAGAFGTSTVNTPVTVASGAAVQLTGGITLTSTNKLTLSGGGNAGIIVGNEVTPSTGALENVSGNNTYAGPITLAAATTISSDSGTLSLTGTGISGAFGLTLAGGVFTAGNGNISAAITTGAGTLTKSGSGTWILSGANTFTGATTINWGILNYQNGTAFGTNSAITVGSFGTAQVQGGITGGNLPLTLGGNGAGTLTGATGALDNVGGTNSYAGPIILTANTIISSDAGLLNLTGATITPTAPGLGLTLAGAGNGSIANQIATGAGALTKAGSGTWTLSAASGYTGTTSVNAGTLIVSGSLAGTASASVAAGATLEVDGLVNAAVGVSGTLLGTGSAGAINSVGGTLEPGESTGSIATGILTSTNNVSLDAKSTFTVRLGVSAPLGTDNDRLATSGTASLSGSLNLILGPTFANAIPGTTFYNIILTGGASDLTGSFANAVPTAGIGTLITASGATFSVLYGSDGTNDGLAGVGGDVTLELTAVPEPGTWAMLLGGAALLCVYHRRRSAMR